jgi:hypothetical protein
MMSGVVESLLQIYGHGASLGTILDAYLRAGSPGAVEIRKHIPNKGLILSGAARSRRA